MIKRRRVNRRSSTYEKSLSIRNRPKRSDRFFTSRIAYRPEPCVITPTERMVRVGVIGAAFFFIALSIAVRLVIVQGTDQQEWLTLARRQHMSSVEIQGARGEIRDRRDRALAVSIETVSVAAHPQLIEDSSAIVKQLAKILSMPETELDPLLKSDSPFVWLARGLPLGVAEDLNKLKTPGITQVREFRRFYPQGTLASPVLGRVSRDGSGQAGLELSYEKTLGAESAFLRGQKDALGRLMGITPINIHGSEDSGLSESPSFKGSDSLRREGKVLSLTIDSVLQGILEEELEIGEKEAKAKVTLGLLVDASTGEILAMGQSNRFEPNDVSGVKPEDMRNIVLQNVFEPGSTFKPLVAALALEHGVVGPIEQLDCEGGSYRVGSHTIRDVHPSNILSFSDVLIRSSNICMTKMGERLGAKRLDTGLRLLGFGETTGLQLKGENAGLLRSLSGWKPIDTATTSFGQGIGVTSLQLVSAYTALANDGVLVTPSIILGGDHQERRVFSSATADKVKEALRGVIVDEHGTGKNAAIDGVEVYGKTGTAQKPRKGGRGYDPDAIFSSFIGFVDASALGVRRPLVLFIGVDEPSVTPRWGGRLAAPIFRQVITRAISHLLLAEPGVLKTAMVEPDQLTEESNQS